MLRILVASRLQGVFSAMFRASRQKKKHGILIKVLIALLAAYVVVAIAGTLGLALYTLLPAMVSAELLWLYFALVAIIAFVFMFVGGVMMTQSVLYEAKDNDLLLSLPIPSGMILLSRMLSLLVMAFLLQAAVAVPAGVVYLMHYAPSFTGVAFFLIAFLFLPLMAVALSSLLGWLIAMVSSRLRNKSIVIIVLSIGMMMGYFALLAGFNERIADLVTRGQTIADAVRHALPPAHWLGSAVADGNAFDLAYFLLSVIIPAVAVYFALSLNFTRIVTRSSVSIRSRGKVRMQNARSPMAALVLKEARRFFTAPMYMLNAGLGTVFTLILPIAMLLKPDILTVLLADELPGMAEASGPMVLVVLCFLAATNFISAPSISLEGKKLWIPQSLPISGGDILLSKAYAHMIICLPTVLFSAAILGVILRATPFIRVMMFLTPALLTVFQALLGVAVNLRFPKFDWMNETIAVKQGISSLITMFTGMGLAAGGAALYIALLSAHMSVELYVILLCALLAFMSFGIFLYLKAKGGRAFRMLVA